MVSSLDEREVAVTTRPNSVRHGRLFFSPLLCARLEERRGEKRREEQAAKSAPSRAGSPVTSHRG